MLAIKLARIGKIKQPYFRFVLLEKTKDPWGDCQEILGTMNPRAADRDIKLNTERVKYWLSKGAQPTDTVRNILIDLGLIKGRKAQTIKISKERRAKMNEKNGVKAEAPAPTPAPEADKPVEAPKA
ncbi:MAG: 30S ribosomal protein S16 [bacterium]